VPINSAVLTAIRDVDLRRNACGSQGHRVGDQLCSDQSSQDFNELILVQRSNLRSRHLKERSRFESARSCSRVPRSYRRNNDSYGDSMRSGLKWSCFKPITYQLETKIPPDRSRDLLERSQRHTFVLRIQEPIDRWPACVHTPGDFRFREPFLGNRVVDLLDQSVLDHLADGLPIVHPSPM